MATASADDDLVAPRIDEALPPPDVPARDPPPRVRRPLDLAALPRLTPPGPAPAAPADSTRAALGAVIALAAVFVLATATLLAMGAPFGEAAMFAVMAGTVAMSAILAMRAFYRALGAFHLIATTPAPSKLGSILSFLGWLILAGFGALVSLVSTMGATRGRQLRRNGRVLLPPVGPGAAWTGGGLHPHAPADLRAALAAQWRENGRTEHASVAAFARLTLDLMALGAPPRLVASANRDALDEIRHAELCFGLARALDGREAGPAAFPEAQRARTLPRSRALALAKLAVDSLVDGALNEGVSARIIARLARRCEDDTTRAMLRGIAADEGRHSAHGWDVVEWCVSEGGAPVLAALQGAALMLPRAMPSTIPGDARSGAWEAWGIPGQALEAEEHARTRAFVTRRVRAIVSARSSATAA